MQIVLLLILTWDDSVHMWLSNLVHPGVWEREEEHSSSQM